MILGVACGRTTPTVVPSPADVSPPDTQPTRVADAAGRDSTPRDEPGLPPIPARTGAPLVLSVVYPPRDATIAPRDSNFILGSVGSGDATLTINGIPVAVEPNGAYLAWLPIPEGTAPVYRLVAVRGADTAALEHPVRTFRTPPPPPSRDRPPATPPRPPRTTGVVSLGDRATAASGRTISVRPVAGGTYKWFAVPGTLVERTGVDGGFVRIRMDSQLEAFVSSADILELPDTTVTTAPRRLIPNVTVVPDSAWTDIVFPVREAPPYLVEQDSDKLVLTLYSTRASTDIIGFRPGDSVIRTITWEPLASDRVRYVIHLRDRPFGYVVRHDGRALVLRVRRPPAVNASRPLDGITIAVDAGHPPAGSRGPTGIYEGDLTLPISVALKEELERRGARVFMTRTTSDPVELTERPLMARAAHAHALISVHLNALPDGVNPRTAHGTGTYFFHPQSEPLARAVQAGMVRTMKLRDLGVYYDNLALVRETWMPSILCEGAFIILPHQEAAMAQPEGQRAYARGVADGVEEYFRSLASHR